MGIIPDTAIRTDEDLAKLLEDLRRMGINGHDELDELAGLVKMKIQRYGRRHGLSSMVANHYGRSVATPLWRAADSMLMVASYTRVCRNRLEAFAVMLDDEHKGASDFEIVGRRK
jgi:hypothetical protein